MNLLKLGAKGYVTKPFTPDKLMNTINAALAS
jgi:DNA-binding response OmpR family regulator